MLIFSIKDEKSGEFNQPFFAPNSVQASRSFAQLLNDNNVQLSLFPDEYSMYMLGEFEADQVNWHESSKNPIKVEPNPIFIIGGCQAKQMITKEKTNVN